MPHRVVRRRPFRASFYARSSSCMCEPEPKSGRRRAASRRAVLPHHRACRSVHGGSQTKRRACGQRGWEGSSRAPPAWRRRAPCRALRLPPRASMPCAQRGGAPIPCGMGAPPSVGWVFRSLARPGLCAVEPEEGIHLIVLHFICRRRPPVSAAVCGLRTPLLVGRLHRYGSR